MKKKCQALSQSTDQPCRKPALPGASYCWAHQPKSPLIISALVGGLIGLGITESWRAIVPSPESKQLTAARKEISDLQNEVKKIQRKPDFSVFLNGVAVTNLITVALPTTLGQRLIQQATVLVPTTSDVQRVLLTVRNVGNLPADKLSVGIRLPAGMKPELGPAWQAMSFMSRTGNGIQEDPSQPSFSTESSHVIDPGAYFSCDPIMFHQSIDQPFGVSVGIEMSALQADKQRANLLLVFARGEGQPQLIAERK